jgi:hypothetical protein
MPREPSPQQYQFETITAFGERLEPNPMSISYGTG